MAASSYAQTVIKKETTVSQLDTLQLDAVPQTDTAEIRPFRFNVPEEQLVDLRRRVAATKRPEREAVSDATQGVQLATLSSPITHLDTENHSRKE